MKKSLRGAAGRLAAAALALMLTVLCSCGKSEEPAPDTREVLTVGMECAYVPFNWESYDDGFGGVEIKGSARFANGYDTKIAQKIADKLDRRLQVVKLRWEELIPALAEGKIDLVIAGMNPYDAGENVVFSAPYYHSDITLVVREDGDYADAESINDFRDAVVAAQSGTPHEILVGQIPDIKDEALYSDYDGMIAALKNGEIDAYIAEFPVARANCEKYKGFTFINLNNNETGFDVGEEASYLSVAMPAGSPYADAVDEVLSGMSEKDQDELMDKCIDRQP